MSKIDLSLLSKSWLQRRNDRRPIGHELRGGDEWVRFHSLPESKRYAESDSERAEILRRHNIVIGELVAGSATEHLIVVTCSWSFSADPAPRDRSLQAVSPSAMLWQSVLRERDEDDGTEYWTHLYVQRVGWRPGELDELLLLVADWQTQDVIIAPANWDWLYDPYDGGADVTTSSTRARDGLRRKHPAWLSTHPDGP